MPTGKKCCANIFGKLSVMLASIGRIEHILLARIQSVTSKAWLEWMQKCAFFYAAKVFVSWHRLAVSCWMQCVQEQLCLLCQNDHISRIKTYKYILHNFRWYLVLAELFWMPCYCSNISERPFPFPNGSSRTMLHLSDYIHLIFHCTCSQCRENEWFYVLCSF